LGAKIELLKFQIHCIQWTWQYWNNLD